MSAILSSASLFYSCSAILPVLYLHLRLIALSGASIGESQAMSTSWIASDESVGWMNT